MILDNNFSTVEQFKNFIINECEKYTLHFTKKKKQRVYYYDVISAFDIETTSLNYMCGDDEIHNGTMYINMLAFNGHAVYFRTWNELVDCLKWLSTILKLNYNRRLIIWVHNLAFEFAFIEHLFNWVEIFAREKRKPITALTDIGIEFRCSYILSGASLSYTLKNEVLRHPIEKMSGDLNYDLLRGKTTPLTDKELKYCLNDVLGVSAYICEVLENENVNLAHIRLTKTGQVRNYCFNHCLGNYIYIKGSTCYYEKLISNLKITSINEYNTLKRAFQGGFTHANIYNVGKVINDVTSYDFTSSYPAVMLSEKYPMSTAHYKEQITIEQLNNYINNGFLLIFDIHLKNIFPKIFSDNILSYSKCWNVKGEKINNGRINYADELCTTITNIDFYNIMDFYNCEVVKITNVYIYRAEYLPKKLLECVLTFYSDKTTLKDVSGKEIEYLIKKGMLNSTFGMSVTDIINNEITFNNVWIEKNVDVNFQLEKYNKNKRRFLFYPWGVFITAYARNNLFSAIKIMGDDYIYADTDSVKLTNAHKYKNYFNNYNETIINKIEQCLEYRKIDINLAFPKTCKNIVKPLGVWDFDGHYEKFKTLGAKRYLTFNNGEYKLTCAGTSKNSVNYIKNNGGFDIFKIGLIIPKTESGRKISYYTDEPYAGEFIDYLGNKQTYEECSGICLQSSDFTIKRNNKFEEFIYNITGEYLDYITY